MSVERIRRTYNPLLSPIPSNISYKITDQPVVIKKVIRNDIKTLSQDNNLNSVMKPILISYCADYNETGYYRGYADILIEKCKFFAINFDICEMSSRDSYGSNCLMKPEFILKKLTEIKKPIIWMDCDTDFIEPFRDFNDVEEDIGMATHTGDLNGIKASPLYFSYSKGAFLIIREWVLHCRSAYIKNEIELDHDSLKHYVLSYLDGKFKYLLLSNNWIDFVNGRYINNGNSKVEGKQYFHRNVRKSNDPIRSTYTSDIKTVNIFMENSTIQSFIDGYYLLSRFSNFSRFRFIFKKNLSLLTDDENYKKLDIESGGMIDFCSEKYIDSPLDINIRFFKMDDIELNWDIKLIELIDNNKNPIELFKGSELEIKYNNNIWN